MADHGSLWALVLAGGDGTRLSSVTREHYGYDRPKQFCALTGPHTLLEQTVARAERAVPRDRVVVSTTRRWHHEADECLATLRGAHVVEQPSNAGTTPAILLGLLDIGLRDPEARVLILPSDHHVGDEQGFVGAALGAAGADAPDIVLLGVELRDPEPGLGWIRPAPLQPGEAFTRVEAFVEKPSAAAAAALHRKGALVNTFAITAKASALLALIVDCVPRWWDAFDLTLRGEATLEDIYARVPASDLSRDVLQPSARILHVARLGEVGWCDLGTPERLRRVQRTLLGAGSPAPAEVGVVAPH